MTPQQSKNDELAALMQPFMSIPVATPAMMMECMKWLNGKLDEITQQEQPASVKQEWGSRSQVGQIYGMTGQRADDLLLPWVAAGKVRVIAPIDPVTGKKGHKRYNLADVAAMMEAKQ